MSDILKLIETELPTATGVVKIIKDAECRGYMKAVIDMINQVCGARIFAKDTNISGKKETMKCEFCQNHEQGDTLYEVLNWDSGIGFDCIRNIKYCPLCGRMLNAEDEGADDE